MYFSWIIMTIFIIGMMVIYFSSSESAKRGDRLPTIITTIGILGTFVGIAYGLMNFDVGNIQASVGQLLEGLKIAFFTSIAGMLGAIAIKTKNVYISHKMEAVHEGASIDTLAALLEEQNSSLNKSLQNIEKSLVGEGDSTIITQIQKIRTSLLDGQEKTNSQIKEGFTTLIAEVKDIGSSFNENFSDTLIKALEEAIKDFNQKITEQFGDNFKQLNVAVGRLLEWQEKYKEQMKLLIEKFDENAKNLTEISSALDNITDHLNTVMEFVDELDGLIKTTDVHIRQLESNLSAFASMADKAKEAFPVIEERINALTEDFANVVKRSVDSNQKAIDNFISSIEEQLTLAREQTQYLQENTTKIITGFDDRVHDLMTKNASVIQKQVEQLDKSLQDELTKSLQTLGSQLASLSEKFVKDYTPLTNRLKEIVEIANDRSRGTSHE